MAAGNKLYRIILAPRDHQCSSATPLLPLSCCHRRWREQQHGRYGRASLVVLIQHPWCGHSWQRRQEASMTALFLLFNYCDDGKEDYCSNYYCTQQQFIGTDISTFQVWHIAVVFWTTKYVYVLYRLVWSHSSFVWHTMQFVRSANWSRLSSRKCCHVSRWRNCCICRSASGLLLCVAIFAATFI